MEPADTPGHSSQITYAEAVAQAAEALIALPAMPHNVLQQVLEQQALLLQQQQILQMQLRIKRRAEALYAAHATTTAQNSLPGRWPGQHMMSPMQAAMAGVPGYAQLSSGDLAAQQEVWAQQQARTAAAQAQ